VPKTMKLSLGNFFELPNPGLRAYFSHVVAGQPDEYRTPFYKGKSLQEILNGWNATLSSIAERWPSLYQFEKDLGEKVGPMSIQKPLAERMEDIESYYSSISKKRIPIKADAIARACDEWKDVAGIRQRSLKRTVDLMKKSTNSGSPFFRKRSDVVKETIPCECEISGDRVMLVLPKRMWQGTAVLGWRGQEGGPEADDTKQRVVWMFPFSVNANELQVYQPLIEAMKNSRGGQGPHVPAWAGMEYVDQEITRMFDTKPANDLVICTDFSKFDQHFNDVLQEAARECLRYLFNAGSIDKWLNGVFPIKYMIPLCLDGEKFMVGPHGMGSGSGGTNADETLAHRCLQHEAALLSGTALNPHSQCLGDDGVLTYPGCTVDDVLLAYTSHGLDMNEDKQYASTQDCVYLRRWHHQDYRVDNVCVGVYSTNRALGRLAEQERFYDPDKWGKEMVALRQLSILENVKYHPLKEEFVDYCMKGDKYRLGLDIPGFFSKVSHLAEEATDYMPDFLGYTRALDEDSASRGIENWWIVNYLKSKA